MLAKLRARREEVFTKMSAIIDAAKEEERDLTAEEVADYDKLEAEEKSLKSQIRVHEKHEAVSEDMEEAYPARAQREPVKNVPGPAAKKEFESASEWLFAVIHNPDDQRLVHRTFDDPYNRFGASHGIKTGQTGGFMVPTQHINRLLSYEPQDMVFGSMAQRLEQGDMPDAAISLPALDQGSDEGIFAGVALAWLGMESDEDFPETSAKFKGIQLLPQLVGGLMSVHNSMLRNWGAGEALLFKLLRQALAHKKELAFLGGDGAGKPIGFLNSDARIDVNRATANEIKYADVLAMDDNFQGENPVWMHTKKAKSQLRQLEDGAGNNIWQESAAAGSPATLLGYPIVENRRLPLLGSRGDLCLVSGDEYLIKPGSGPFVQTSEHVDFKKDKTAIRILENVDGQPWMNEPFQLEDKTTGQTETASPFVVLDVPSA
jgi:HK97 family phage major capsid protein